MSHSLVTIRVEGGVIQDIELPAGVNAVVYDYDVEGADASDISVDDNGDDCVMQTWGPDEPKLETKPNGGISAELVKELVAWTKTAEPELESIVVTPAQPEEWHDNVEWRTT